MTFASWKIDVPIVHRGGRHILFQLGAAFEFRIGFSPPAPPSSSPLSETLHRQLITCMQAVGVPVTIVSGELSLNRTASPAINILRVREELPRVWPKRAYL